MCCFQCLFKSIKSIEIHNLSAEQNAHRTASQMLNNCVLEHCNVRVVQRRRFKVIKLLGHEALCLRWICMKLHLLSRLFNSAPVRHNSHRHTLLLHLLCFQTKRWHGRTSLDQHILVTDIKKYKFVSGHNQKCREIAEWPFSLTLALSFSIHSHFASFHRIINIEPKLSNRIIL